MRVGWDTVIEYGGWCLVVDDGGWKNVEKVGSKLKGIVPIGRRDGSVKKVCANDVVDGPKYAFGLAVLGGGIWA